MNAYPSFVELIIVAIALFGFGGLLLTLLVNKRTRMWGVGLGVGALVLVVAASLSVFTYTIAARGSAAQERVKEDFRKVQEAQRAVQVAELDRRLDELNQPRIDLDDPSESRRAGVTPLLVETRPPAWGDRPAEEYTPESEFMKRLYAEHDADWITIRAPKSKQGLKSCLAAERRIVLKDVRRYVAKRSKTELADDAPLGMSTAEIFKRFVNARRLVEKDGVHTIYTMLVIKNDDGGDELVAKTLALLDGRSAEKLDRSRSAEPLPDWVTTPPKRVGKFYRHVLKSGPYATVEECRRDTDAKLVAVASSFATGNTLVLGEGASVPDPPRGLPFHELRERLTRDEFIGAVDASFGEMKMLYTLVEITPEDGQWLIARQQEAEQTQRLTFVAIVACGVLALVAGALALLKIDELTRGYYSKRLLVGVPVALIACVMAALVLLA